jgi:hypothetical protein
MASTLSDFRLDEITDANLRAQLQEKLATDDEFVPTTPRVWIADFKADSVRYQAGIQVGHRHGVDSDTVQADVQLRIRNEDFDNDTFLSVSKIRDISKLVGDEFEKRFLSSKTLSTAARSF